MSRAVILAIATSVASVPLTAQASSSAFVTGAGAFCIQNSPASPISSSATCPATAIDGGTGASATTADVGARTADASAALTQTGADNTMNAHAEGYSTNNGVIYLTGSPSATDNLVFHFLTDANATAGPAGTSASSAFWQLFLAGGSATSSVNQNAYADGTSGPIDFTSAVAAPGGVDLILPFDAFDTSSGTAQLNFWFQPDASVTLQDQPSGTAGSASITATLAGVDAVNAQGQQLGRTVFSDDGSGVLTLMAPVTTTPEPSSLAMLGTGLVGLVPVVRRMRRV